MIQDTFYYYYKFRYGAKKSPGIQAKAIGAGRLNGIGCNTSTKGVLNMTRLGFKVKELAGGIEWWKFDEYPTEGTKVTASAGINCDC